MSKLLIFFLIAAEPFYGYWQKVKEKERTNNCELNVLRLHDVNAMAGREELIIVIARLGKNEQSRRFNNRRLHNVKVYLEEFLGRLPKTTILAEGGRTDGKPRLELYVKGKLLDTLELEIGEDVSVGSCDNTSPADKRLFKTRLKRW